ncbi:MAG TPA: phosphatidylglycerol lysyltransferase domain-containing protein, partial [Vicinamibacteria bacterium]|nr:phosphatidylglycerol lysyltransferase domain-containing protein [Vicinamibacteria bacterium]
MRTRSTALPGSTDILLARSLLSLQGEGFREASLGSAPLKPARGPEGRAESGVELLFEDLNRLYGSDDLRGFKEALGPVWRRLHLAYPRGGDLSRIARAVGAIHGSAGPLGLVLGG